MWRIDGSQPWLLVIEDLSMRDLIVEEDFVFIIPFLFLMFLRAHNSWQAR